MRLQVVFVRVVWWLHLIVFALLAFVSAMGLLVLPQLATPPLLLATALTWFFIFRGRWRAGVPALLLSLCEQILAWLALRTPRLPEVWLLVVVALGIAVPLGVSIGMLRIAYDLRD